VKPFSFAGLVFLAGFSLLRADDRIGDLPRSAGVWNLVSVTDDGSHVPEASLRGMTITIAGNVYMIRHADKVLERGTFVLNSSPNPKAIDTTVTEGPGKGMTSLGIYSLSDTTRSVCLAPPGQPRPTKFEAPSGTKWALFIARRETKGEAAKHDLEQLQGDWQMESMERGGKKVDERLAKGFKRTVTGNRYTVTWFEEGATQTLVATMSLDPTKEPRTIDLVLANGALKGKTRLGIYRVEGDTETVCLAQPGQIRPTAFDSKQGAIHVWKRVKK